MDDKITFKHLGLFEGIGGFSLAARWMGWETVAWCEWNDFAQKVLKYHSPNAEGFGDITKTDFTRYANRIDILTGGFPCQPYSVAGKRKGKNDERHLWPEMLRAIREIKPRWVVGENVLGLVNWNGGLVFDEVQTDLEAEGYEVQPYVLPACAVNAPHRRDRVWFVAYRNGVRLEQRKNSGEVGIGQTKMEGKRSKSSNAIKTNGKTEYSSNTVSIGQPGEEHGQTCTGLCGENSQRHEWHNFPTQPPICGRNDGISERLDTITFPKWRKESIKAYGNAIVPQVAYEIYKAIEKYELYTTN